MAYYLSQFVGDGSSVDPFRPPVTGEFGIIDLRGDATVSAGRCLLWHPDGSLSDSRLDKVADSTVESIPRNIARRIENALGVSLDQFDTLQAIIAELLILHGSFTDPGRWKPLRANHRGRHVIHLGGKVYDAPAPVGTVITESFNTADSDTLGPDLTWTEVAGDFDVLNNQGHMPGDQGGFPNSARAESDLATVDHYCEADVTWDNGNSGFAGTCVRFSASAHTCYAGHAAAYDDSMRLSKVTTGSASTIASQAASEPQTQTRNVRTEADGSTISTLIEGYTELSTTDTGITGNTRTGITGHGRTDVTRTISYDNFEAGDLTSFDPANLQASVLDDDVTLTWDSSF